MASGEVSERPYPSRTWTWKRSLNCRMISTGRLAPPETAIRRFAAMRSTSTSSVRAPSRPQYIVGTPAKNVTFSFWSRARAFSASNLGSRTSVAPTAKPAFICTVEPNEWWHFNYRDWEEYQIADVPFSAIR